MLLSGAIIHIVTLALDHFHGLAETKIMKARSDDPVWFSIGDLTTRYDVTRVCIYQWQKKRGFPKGVKLGGRMVRWRAEAVYAWENERTA